MLISLANSALQPCSRTGLISPLFNQRLNMTSLRIRQYGSTSSTQINFTGELENELCQQMIAAIQAGFVWPGDLEDFHLTVWSDELGRWIDA